MNGSSKKTVRWALVLAALAAAGGPALAQDADVWVVHGIPGADLGLDPALPVDVLVNDSLCVLAGFELGDVAGPLPLAPGTYNVKIGLADASDPCSEPAVIEADVPVAAGESASIVAHLDAAGAPTASKFVNDLSPTGPGRARLIVQHVAAAPDVDVDVARPDAAPALTITELANGDQAAAEVRPGRWNTSIRLAGQNVVVFGPVSLQLRPFTAYFVYAVGTPANGTFTLIVEEALARLGPASAAAGRYRDLRDEKLERVRGSGRD